MTPTLPTDLISAKDVLEWIYAGMIDAELSSEQEMLEKFETLIKSRLSTPAVHSADGLLTELAAFLDEEIAAMDRLIAAEDLGGNSFHKENFRHEKVAFTVVRNKLNELNTRHQGADKLPLRVEFALDYLLGYMSGEPEEARSKLKAIADHLRSTAPGQEGNDDPMNLNACPHPDCGRFYDNNAKRMSCRAFADGACAQKCQEPTPTTPDEVGK